MTPLAKRIKNRRLELGMSQTDLGREAGCGQQLISKIEKGETTKTGYIVEIAQALGVESAWLLFGGEGGDTGHRRGRCPCREKSAPLLSLEEAARYEDTLLEIHAPDSDGGDWIPIPTRDHHGHSCAVFWVEQTGKGMDQDAPPGIWLLVDPLDRPEPGGLVVARPLDGNGQAIVRRYRERTDGFDLVPDNHYYAERDETGWAIVGRVLIIARST